MRVLYAATFDPAGVMAGHRTALRALGVETFLALDADYWQAGPDQQCPRPDVIVIAPGIGWGQSGDLGTQAEPFAPLSLAGDLSPSVHTILSMFPEAKRVAYFHGSIQTAANREAYRRYYVEAGCRIAASTLDYAVNMGAAYLPPVAIPAAIEAPRRLVGQRLIVAHTPTNPAICSTEDFFAIAKAIGIDVRYAHGVSHAEALAAKVAAHATFDHLRGSFSVNSLEAAAVGSVPLFGLGQAEEDRLRAEGYFIPPAFVVRDLAALRKLLVTLDGSVGFTRTLQAAARPWADQFSYDAIGLRLKRFFEEVLG